MKHYCLIATLHTCFLPPPHARRDAVATPVVQYTALMSDTGLFSAEQLIHEAGGSRGVES
jgi:hypothetical protein